MKAKPLRLRHIIFLHENEMNPKRYLFVKEDFESYTFQDIEKKKLVTIRR